MLFAAKNLFSEVRGLVVGAEGRPVVEGRFYFPAIMGSSFWAGVLPHEPVITQAIVIRRENEEYEAWRFSKHNYREDGCYVEPPPLPVLLAPMEELAIRDSIALPFEAPLGLYRYWSRLPGFAADSTEARVE